MRNRRRFNEVQTAHIIRQVLQGLADMHNLLEPSPLVIPRQETLSSLICEVLHPSAHWTGVLGNDKPKKAGKPAASGSGSTKPGDLL